MPQNRTASLWISVMAAGRLSSPVAIGAGPRASWSELASLSLFDCTAGDLHGRSVLLATAGQFATAAAMLQLDGGARRMVLYPSDLPRGHLSMVADSAG